MGNAPRFELIASDGRTWSTDLLRGQSFVLVFHTGAFTEASQAILDRAPPDGVVLVLGPDAVPAQRAWLKKIGRPHPCARDAGALASAYGMPTGGIVTVLNDGTIAGPAAAPHTPPANAPANTRPLEVVQLPADPAQVDPPSADAPTEHPAEDAPPVSVPEEIGPTATDTEFAPIPTAPADGPAAPPPLEDADSTDADPTEASPVHPAAAAPPPPTPALATAAADPLGLVPADGSNERSPPPLARPSTVARKLPPGARPAPPPPPTPPAFGGRDLLLVALGIFVGAGVTWMLMRPAPPPAPKEKTGAVAPVSPPPPVAGTPGASALTVVEEDLSILNLSLTEDGGGLTGFGDTDANNGIPDGWRYNLKSGKLSFEKSPPRDGQEWVTVRYDQGTAANLLSRHVPAKEGETFVLTASLDTGEGTPLHPGAFGIAFFRGQEFLDWGLHRVENEFPGAQAIEIRATAPAGTDMMRVRWHFMEDAKKPGGTFSFAVPIVKRLTAQSRTRTFPLKHIFLLTVETFRSDHTTMRGYARATTPNLARIAEEGAYLDRHYVQAPYTRPSLSSLVTSQFPASLGVRDNVDFLPSTATTVSERFAEGGYVTAAFLAQYVLSQHYGFNQGFHYFYNYKNDTPGEEVWNAFQPWFKEHAPDNTFTWVHLFDPHGPYHPSDERRARFEGDALYNADDQKLTPGKGAATGMFVPAYVYDEGELERRHYVAGYDAEISGIDEQIGAFIDSLKSAGIANESMVVVTADHGESMTDHDRWFCHGNLYEHDLRVPMIVWAPGRVKPGTRIDARTTHLDIVPTLLDYAGVPLTGRVNGTSMRPLLDGSGGPTHTFSFAGVGKAEKEQIAILGDGPLKVIVDHQGVPVEVYELAKDPEERTNLVATRAAEAADVAKRFRAWLESETAGGPAAAPVQLGRELAPDERERLKALGYIE